MPTAQNHCSGTRNPAVPGGSAVGLSHGDCVPALPDVVDGYQRLVQQASRTGARVCLLVCARRIEPSPSRRLQLVWAGGDRGAEALPPGQRLFLLLPFLSNWLMAASSYELSDTGTFSPRRTAIRRAVRQAYGVSTERTTCASRFPSGTTTTTATHSLESPPCDRRRTGSLSSSIAFVGECEDCYQIDRLGSLDQQEVVPCAATTSPRLRPAATTPSTLSAHAWASGTSTAGEHTW